MYNCCIVQNQFNRSTLGVDRSINVLNNQLQHYVHLWTQKHLICTFPISAAPSKVLLVLVSMIWGTCGDHIWGPRYYTKKHRGGCTQ